MTVVYCDAAVNHVDNFEDTPTADDVRQSSQASRVVGALTSQHSTGSTSTWTASLLHRDDQATPLVSEIIPYVYWTINTDVFTARRDGTWNSSYWLFTFSYVLWVGEKHHIGD